MFWNDCWFWRVFAYLLWTPVIKSQSRKMTSLTGDVLRLLKFNLKRFYHTQTCVAAKHWCKVFWCSVGFMLTTYFPNFQAKFPSKETQVIRMTRKQWINLFVFLMISTWLQFGILRWKHHEVLFERNNSFSRGLVRIFCWTIIW